MTASIRICQKETHLYGEILCARLVHRELNYFWAQSSFRLVVQLKTRFQ